MGNKRTKWVYRFSQGEVEGRRDMKDLLGGKGANLAEMTGLGLPVPPGFSISTAACLDYVQRGQGLSSEIKDQCIEALQKVERVIGKKIR